MTKILRKSIDEKKLSLFIFIFFMDGIKLFVLFLLLALQQSSTTDKELQYLQ